MTTNTIASLTFLLAKPSFQSVDQIKNILTAQRVIDEANFQNTSNISTDRWLHPVIIENQLKVTDYGCWCNFHEKSFNGKGAPVDDLDTRCKQLHQGYDCIILDAEREGVTDCSEPWTVGFSNGGWEGYSKYNSTKCDSENDSWCSRKVCHVEASFLRDVLDWQRFPKNDEFYHDQGFDPSLSCNPTRTDAYFQTDAAKLATPPPPSTNRGPNGGGGNGNDNSESEVSYALIDRAECCGEYPIRFKYHTIDSNGGDRSCCGPDSNGMYKTYNSNLLECCATGDVTGDVKPVGDC